MGKKVLWADELTSTLRHGAQQQLSTHSYAYYGRVASYDPTLHRVRVLLMSLRNEDGAPVLSPWLPLASPWVGSGFGLQVVPYGGATAANPTAGEPCIVFLLERTYGVSASAMMLFDGTMLPPGQSLAAGEALLQAPSGSQVYLKANGDVQVSATGTVWVLGTAIKLAKALTDTLQAFCTTAFATWAANHIHNVTGSVTSVPTTSAPANGLTTIVTGE